MDYLFLIGYVPEFTVKHRVTHEGTWIGQQTSYDLSSTKIIVTANR